MKYCQNCNIPLDDNASFCIECGGIAMGSADNPTYDYSSVPLLSKKSVIDTVREWAKSKLFLVTIIIFTVSWLLGFIISLYNAIVDPSVDFTVGGEVVTYASSAASVIVAIIIAIPAALMVAGMWMTYGSAKSDNERMTSSGLTLVKVATVITLILTCILVGFIVLTFSLALVLFKAGGILPEIWGESENNAIAALLNGSFIALFTIILVLVVVIGALAIIYEAFAIKTVNSIKSTIETGRPTVKASSFVAVMSIIIGGFYILSALLSLEESSFVAILNSLLSSASFILLGIVLLNYKNKISELNN